MANGDGDPGMNGPSAAVAIALVALVGLVTVSAIIRYDVDSALKIWGAMGPIIGLFTGAFVTYFFARQAIQSGRSRAQRAQERALLATAEATEARTQASVAEHEAELARGAAERAAQRTEDLVKVASERVTALADQVRSATSGFKKVEDWAELVEKRLAGIEATLGAAQQRGLQPAPVSDPGLPA